MDFEQKKEIFEKYISTRINENNPIFFNDSFGNDSLNYYDNESNLISNYKINDPYFQDSSRNFLPLEQNSSLFLLFSQQNMNPPRPNTFININHNNKNTNCKNILGRKLKKSGIKGEHDKYAENNMIRKFKVLLKDKLLEHINNIIKKDINLSINIDDKEYKVDCLLNIRQEQIINTNINENIEFLNKLLKEIFSDEINGKYRNFPKNYNKKVIEELYKTENNQNVTRVLDMTFLECVKFFRKEENLIDNEDYECLRGLEKIYENLSNHLKEDDKNDSKFINKFTDLIKDFENIFYNKKPRAKRNKKSKSN